jgi:hypothetical protein
VKCQTHLLVDSHVERWTEDLANGVMWCSRPGDLGRRCSNSKKFQGPELTGDGPKETGARKTMGLPVLVPRYTGACRRHASGSRSGNLNDVFVNMAHGSLPSPSESWHSPTEPPCLLTPLPSVGVTSRATSLRWVPSARSRAATLRCPRISTNHCPTPRSEPRRVRQRRHLIRPT